MQTQWFILARAVHFAACLLFFGLFAFDLFIVPTRALPSEIMIPWHRRTAFTGLILLPIIFISGVTWFFLVAVGMGGRLDMETLKTVWTQTQFGTVWEIRLCVWIAAMTVAVLAPRFKIGTRAATLVVWLELILGSLLLGSLAWAGHGQETSNWHLYADVFHLIAAGFWPAGLLPFALFFQKLRNTKDDSRWDQISLLVRRFSTVSICIVALLTITGWINSWYLVGSFANLFHQPYGRWLLAKIVLVCLTVAIGAVNLLKLKPRILSEEQRLPTAASLQRNVWSELLIGLLIVIIVAILGILPPCNAD